MRNIGPTELLVLAVLLAVAALFLIGVIRLATRGSRGSAAPRPRLDPAELHRQATGLITAGKTIQAVKLVREQTGLGLADAKRYTDDLAAGRPPYPAFPHPGHTTAPGHTAAPQPAADLAGRVRHLKATGHTEQAVLLVRGETGMNDADARRFVDSLT
ncbi:hypothetical protein ACFYSC_28395 [Streptosporangium sp. NPDC004379]|uniref:hypothetical protein n=1 Tax=Streptosporangium sp. NPDC004379 TaxID=3366189 RepID=UPI00369E795F